MATRRRRAASADDYRDDKDDDYEDEPRSRRRSRDEDEDEPTGRSRRSRGRDDDDDDDDERPARSPRSRGRSDEDEDDEPRGRSRRRPSRDDDDDDDEDEKPRGRSRRRKSSDDEDDEKASYRRRANSRDDDDDDDEPRGRRRKSRDDDDDDEPREPKRKLKGGRNEAKRIGAETSDFAFELKVTDEEQVIAFLEDEPVVAWAEHWIERKGKKSWVCLKSFGKDEKCPLCNMGDKPKAKTAYNVVLLDPKEDPCNALLICGPRLEGVVAKAYNSKAGGGQGCLTEGYYAISSNGKGGQTNYTMPPIKERDLDEDFQIAPLTDKEFTKLEKGMYDETAVPTQSYKQLREIADEYLD